MAVMVKDAKRIRYHLEKAFSSPSLENPGQYGLIYSNIQNAKVIRLPCFTNYQVSQPSPNLKDIEEVLTKLKNAKDHNSYYQGNEYNSIHKFFNLIEKLKIPFVTARNGNDIVNSDYEYFVGRPGTYIQRGANFAVQVCDFYLAIGTKLTYTQTGYNSRDYTYNAFKVVVDIDQNELDKDTMDLQLKIHSDAGKLLICLMKWLMVIFHPCQRIGIWLLKCKEWQQKYDVVLPEYRSQVHDKFLLFSRRVIASPR